MWGKLNLKNTSVLHYVTGLTELWFFNINEGTNIIRKNNKEISGFNIEELDNIDKLSLPSVESSEKYCLPGTINTLRILPRTPDKPVMLNSSINIVILPKQKSLFFIKIPSFIQLSTEKKEETVFEYSSVPLSKTWFGYEHKGSLCYTVTSDFDQKINIRDDIGPYFICPLEIENSSDIIFTFNKIYFEVNNLNIYMGDNNLWSNPCKIEYLNDEGMGKLSYFNRHPEFDNADKIICSSRNGIIKSTWKIKRIV